MARIWTDEGWLYLAVVLDLSNREVVGWSIKPRMTADIVIDALTMAWFRRKPAIAADHPITTSRIEAGNVSIALLRRGAGGFRDTEYFKLKILQLNTDDTSSFLHSKSLTPPRRGGHLP